MTATPAGFAVDASGAGWCYRGELTFATAGAVLAASARLPLPPSGIVDCDGVTSLDSTAVAVLLALRRRAAVENKPLTFANPPQSLRALALLYDVTAILGFAE